MRRPSDAMLMSTADICEGVFSPIPTLRSLALQRLVLSNLPTEEFVPGEGYSHQARSLRLLTRDCVGEYQMTGMEETFVYGDGVEGTDKDKESVRADELNTGVVQVTKPSSREWAIGDLLRFSPGGCLRHVFRDQGNTDVMEWIEGSSLVCHRFSEWLYTNEDEDKFGVDFRVAVTFYQDMFIYREKA